MTAYLGGDSFVPAGLELSATPIEKSKHSDKLKHVPRLKERQDQPGTEIVRCGRGDGGEGERSDPQREEDRMFSNHDAHTSPQGAFRDGQVGQPHKPCIDR